VNAPATVSELKAVCRNCHGGCGTIVRLENGAVTEVVGDPDNPINRGKLCVKAGASTARPRPRGSSSSWRISNASSAVRTDFHLYQENP